MLAILQLLFLLKNNFPSLLAWPPPLDMFHFVAVALSAQDKPGSPVVLLEAENLQRS
jgi:hypothetical protein